MKFKLLGIVCLALVVLAQCASFGAVPSENKYIQSPKMQDSFDFASDVGSGMVMFDDWVCPDGRPITDIHWWGSYWTKPGGNTTVYSDTLQNAPNGGIEYFVINIYSNLDLNDPNNTDGFSRPGDLLATYQINGDCNETYYGQIVKTRNADGSPKIYENVYQYDVDLTQLDLTPFAQKQGETYWISIMAGLEDDEKQWGWHEGDGHWGSLAVQRFGIEEGPMWIPCGGHDMAFALTTQVPEPGSLLALGTGLTGLVGFFLRKRS